MILLDANLFMYAAGAPHPNKEPAVRFLERVALGEIDGVIDAEVLQEILHRYRSIGRPQDGQTVFRIARQLCPTVLDVTGACLDRAAELLRGDDTLMTRDAVHAAVCQLTPCEAIATFDRDFDRLPVRRVDPERMMD
jgi:predicted nucleic acid-binding protein